MLELLRRKGSKRKLRLFAVACCRQIWKLLKEDTCRKAVETAELYADRAASVKDLRDAARKAEATAQDRAFTASCMMRMSKWAERDAAYAATHAAGLPLFPREVAANAKAAVTATQDRQKCQSALLRDLFGPLLFRPVVFDAAWRGWNDGLPVNLAKAIYEERVFDRLPILADALEEAGCDDADILAHCRSGGEHVRGCWVVDLLLGKR
jgi:hypothetical protein